MGDVIRNTLMITGFVLVMMMLLEYITIFTKGKWSKPFQQHEWLQILFGALLGLAPGCLGTYTAVSLYAHRTFKLPALIATMIATTGDEAYIMFSAIPETAIKLNLILFPLAILTGFVISAFYKKKTLIPSEIIHQEFHEHEDSCSCYEPKQVLPQLKSISFERTLLLVIISGFIYALFTGILEHEHFSIFPNMADTHDHEHENNFNWVNISALIASFIAFFIVLTVPEHYLQHHLWEHLLKKHFFKIFLWTFGALLVIHFGIEYLDLNSWLQNNLLLTLLLALLIGLIPESGPHIIFITLFMNGGIPFSVLLANSIVQDGHGALPLLAESKKTFVVMKAVKFAIALLFGLSGYFFGF